MIAYGTITGLQLNASKTVVLPIGNAAIPADFDQLGFQNDTKLKILGITIEGDGSIIRESRGNIS